MTMSIIHYAAELIGPKADEPTESEPNYRAFAEYKRGVTELAAETLGMLSPELIHFVEGMIDAVREP